MPAHIKKNSYGVYYLVDGFTNKSLKTKIEREAKVRLKQYQQGKFGLIQTPTVQQFYDGWIAKKIPPLVRQSQTKNYRQAFNAYILPRFRYTVLTDIKTKDLGQFQAELIDRGLAVKTCRNIIDGSFRAMYRDARVEIGGDLEGKDPFIDIQWPRQPKTKPDPFTAEERDRIIQWYVENDFFYYPLIAWQFHTGMRPSETFALTWRDIDLEAGTVSINKSRNMSALSATKTANSERTIQIDEALISIVKLLPSRELGIPQVFVGKYGRPMTGKWAENFWRAQLKKVGIERHRKFYATRHTTITELVKAGHKLKEIADYCGTSVTMIEQNYCARQQLRPGNREVFEKLAKNINDIMGTGAGFKPAPTSEPEAGRLEAMPSPLPSIPSIHSPG